MPDDFFGVPLHPLVVHAAVVFVPLAALGTILLAAVPGWRRTYGWLLVIASGVALATVPLAVQTGRRLLEMREFGGPVLEKVLEHEQMAERLIWAVAPLFVLNVATTVMIRSGRRPGHVTAVAWLAVIPAAAAVVIVVLTGHLGSMAVWNPTG